jgi:RNA polymerase sigma-70 factor (ECF subfamily)
MRLPRYGPRPKNQDAVDHRRQSFEALVCKDWDRFFRFSVHTCKGNRDDAEDLLAESMVEAFQAFDRFRGGDFDRWFFRIISNNRVDMVRRQRVRQTASLEDLTGSGDPEGSFEIADRRSLGPEPQLMSAHYAEPVEAALNELPEEFRSVVLLCDVEGMDYQGIADTLGVPIGTVRSRLARGRERLRKRLENYLAQRV